MVELKVFVQWTEFLKWLLPVTDNFPRKARFTFTTRIDNLALDILGDIIECRYLPGVRKSRSQKMNVKLEKLRVLLRLSCELRYLSPDQLEHAVVRINGSGRMLRNWLNGDAEE